jgi:hypothetical protein
MSIDRTGKGPVPGAPQGVGAGADVKSTSVDSAERTGKTFEVGGPAATNATAAATDVSPADKVRAGELSLDGYLDQRVAEATRHLDGKLPASDLADIQKMLRSQLATDPTLIEMVRAATGAVPAASQDE